MGRTPARCLTAWTRITTAPSTAWRRAWIEVRPPHWGLLTLGGALTGRAVGAEIDIDLHPDHQRPGIDQVHDDLQNVDVSQLVARAVRAHAPRPDDLGNRLDRSGKCAILERVGLHDDALADPHFAEVALVQLRPHAQGRQ